MPAGEMTGKGHVDGVKGIGDVDLHLSSEVLCRLRYSPSSLIIVTTRHSPGGRWESTSPFCSNHSLKNLPPGRVILISFCDEPLDLNDRTQIWKDLDRLGYSGVGPSCRS